MGNKIFRKLLTSFIRKTKIYFSSLVAAPKKVKRAYREGPEENNKDGSKIK